MDESKGTPESDFSIECFQNYTAPEVFIQGLAGIVDQQDVESMIRAQKQMWVQKCIYYAKASKHKVSNDKVAFYLFINSLCYFCLE